MSYWHEVTLEKLKVHKKQKPKAVMKSLWCVVVNHDHRLFLKDLHALNLLQSLEP